MPKSSCLNSKPQFSGAVEEAFNLRTLRKAMRRGKKNSEVDTKIKIKFIPTIKPVQFLTI